MTTVSPAALPVAPPPAAPAPGRRSAVRRRGARAAVRWISPLAILGLWQLASSTGTLSPRTLASPTQIARTALDLLRDGTLGAQTLVSVERVALGFAIGAVVALVLALVAGSGIVGDAIVDPPMQMLRTLPHLGLVPLFIIWMGIGETPKVALIALGVVFPLYLNTLAGIRSIDRTVLEAARAMRLTWAQRIRHVVVPGAMPHTLTGLRQSLGIAWLTLIVAESISARSGLGYLINHARDFLQIDVIVVGLAVYALLGLTTDVTVRFIESKVLAWRS